MCLYSVDFIVMISGIEAILVNFLQTKSPSARILEYYWKNYDIVHGAN